MAARIRGCWLSVTHQSRRDKFPPFHSAHEGYAVLLEEVDELWDEVKKKPRNREPQKMRAEAIQIAAMALRMVLDVVDNGLCTTI